MNNSILINKLKKATPKKILNKIIKLIIDCYKRNKDLNFYNHHSCDLSINCSYVDIRELDVSGIDKKVASYLSNMYLEHRFDLLGSGWVKNSYDSVPLGVEGYKYDHNLNITEFDKNGNWLKYIVRNPYLKKSKEVWKNISPGYIPIDWQKDYKSGYRYSAKKWYKDQKVAPLPGVDIKVPWELARFQHLPQLAIFALKLPEKKDLIIKEFKNQVLDFIATNPVRFGVNWTCTMDVAIRASNWLIAYDVFKQIDDNKILDNSFYNIFSSSIYLHHNHIRTNYENINNNTNNHYLSNLIGDFIIHKYLDNRTEETKYLARQIFTEIDKQFNNDGTNFEGSTTYHALSTEMIIYFLSFLLNDSKNLSEFERIIINKIYPAFDFLVDTLQKNGNLPQIGDNDSSSFIKLTPSGVFLTNDKAEKKYLSLINYNKTINSYKFNDEEYWDENVLNYKNIVGLIYGLTSNNKFNQSKLESQLESSMIRAISKNNKMNYIQKKNKKIIISADYDNYEFRQTKTFNFNHNEQHLTDGLTFVFYPEFGAYIFKSERVYLFMIAPPKNKYNKMVHFHDDSLSFDLIVDGLYISRDPGSYLYSPIPEIRKKMITSETHNNINILSEKKNPFTDGICSVSEIRNNYLSISFNKKNLSFKRSFTINENSIIINDQCNKEFETEFNKCTYLTNGYGRLLKSE